MRAVGNGIQIAASLALVILVIACFDGHFEGLDDFKLRIQLREVLTLGVPVGIGYLTYVGWRGRRLYARWEQRKLQGICAGISDYFHVSLWLVRLAFVGLFASGLGGATIYFLLALLVDFHPDDREYVPGSRAWARRWRRTAS